MIVTVRNGAAKSRIVRRIAGTPTVSPGTMPLNPLAFESRAMTDARAPHFVPVADLERLGRLLVAGRALPARIGAGVSGDGLWREQLRADGGALFLLIDVEGKG